MSNCIGNITAKLAALLRILDLVRSEANKGRLSSSLVNPVSNILSNKVEAAFRAGATADQLNSLVNANLPVAIAQATAQSNSSSNAIPEDYSGVGLFGSNGNGSNTSELAGLLGNRDHAGSFFDESRTDPNSAYSGIFDSLPSTSINASDIDPVGNALRDELGLNGGMNSDGGLSNIIGNGNSNGGVIGGGQDITAGEISDYFNGYINWEDDSFAIALWLKDGSNPMLRRQELSYAKRIHNEIVLPVATYYKSVLYGNPKYPTRLGKIIYGIVSEEVIKAELRGGFMSRHLLGQAANFIINGVDDGRVIADISNGVIQVDYGTIDQSAAVHVTLPFYAATGEEVRKMLLYTNRGVPGFVGYKTN